MDTYYRIPCESELGCQLLSWGHCRDAAKVIEDSFLLKYSIKSHKHGGRCVVGMPLPTEFWGDADMSGWVKSSELSHYVPASTELGRAIRTELLSIPSVPMTYVGVLLGLIDPDRQVPGIVVTRDNFYVNVEDSWLRSVHRDMVEITASEYKEVYHDVMN